MGLLWLFSQFARVFRHTPSLLANAAWVNFSSARRLISSSPSGMPLTRKGGESPLTALITNRQNGRINNPFRHPKNEQNQAFERQKAG
jgi:hypothetical protein